MKVNLDYYRLNNELNKLTSEEISILDKFFKESDETADSYDKLLTLESSFSEIKALSDNRRNIVEFYPISKDETVLEIGAGFGEVTSSFLDRAKRVVSIESKKEKAEAIAKRYNSYENLEVYAGEIEDIILEDKFDIVSLIGVIELKTDLQRYLDFAKNHLKEFGKIIIVINNKFGIKHFAGVLNENSIKSFESISNESKFLGIDDVENELEDIGFKYKKYYPMPDYTFTNAVYTDEFLPTVDHIVSRDLECFDIEKNKVNFSERDILKEFIKKDPNMFKSLANSYLVVATKGELDDEIKAVTYGTFRKPEYRIKTIIKDKEVVKTANSKEAINHIKNVGNNIELLSKYGIKALDVFENDSIKSKYISEVKPLDKILSNLAVEEDIEGYITELTKFNENVLEKLEKVDFEKIKGNTVLDKYDVHREEIYESKFTFVKDGIFDLIPQNCFVIDGEYYVYDQEWIEENVPLEYIVYRIILNLPETSKYLDVNKIYERLNLTQYTKMFDELDGKIQNGLRNDVFWEAHMKSIKSIMQKEDDFNKVLYDKDTHIRNLEIIIANSNEKIASYEQQLAVISNSLSWKLTKPFRFLGWILNPFSGASFLDRIMPPGGRRRIKYDEKLTKKLWQKKIDGYKAATDEAGVEYWKGIEHRERLLRERSEDRKKLGEWTNYEYWMEANELSLEEIELQRKHKFKRKPKISIVVPLYNTPEDLFRELLFSLYRQTYSNWELCLADGSNEPLEYIKNMCKDSRIKYKYLGKNLGISGNSNEGLKMVTGDWVALLDHDDLLKIDALHEIVKVINENPKVRFIYTDEDKIKDIDNIRFDAHFKPGFSMDYIRSTNYICHLSVFKKEVMNKLGGFRDEYNGAQDLDIILRMTEIVDKKDIIHIPKVLYHWRVWETSTAGNPEIKLYAYESGRKAVEDHINRIGLKGIVERNPNMYGVYRIKYETDSKNEKVSIIVFDYTSKENLENTINSILENTDYDNYEICILENDNEEVKNYLKSIEKDNIVIYRDFENIDSKIAKLNYISNKVDSKFLAFVNGNVKIDSKEWLRELIGYARRNNTGAVGGKIIDKFGKINFAGRVVNSKGIMDVNKGLSVKEIGYFSKESHTQNVTSVSSKLMVVSKEKFDKVNGFDERLEILSDVELNLKLIDEGYVNVYNPYVEAIIEKDELIVDEKYIAESNEIISRRNILEDAYYNINFIQDNKMHEIRKDKV